jgi:hypothetical protein
LDIRAEGLMELRVGVRFKFVDDIDRDGEAVAIRTFEIMGINAR